MTEFKSKTKTNFSIFIFHIILIFIKKKGGCRERNCKQFLSRHPPLKCSEAEPLPLKLHNKSK